jgi:NitT/TauT family transport system substrate-binding protein
MLPRACALAGSALLALAFLRPDQVPALAAQPPLAKVTFLTNYVFHGRYAPFFVGVEQGFYKDAGFDVTITPATGSAFVISAVDAGKADFGMAESASVVQAVAKGATVKGFAVFMDRSTSGLAGLAPYPTLESVAGPPIAASLTDSARVILPILFRRRGLDPATINWVTADPSVYFSLLLGGRAALMTASSDGDVPALARVAEPRGRQVHFTAFSDWGYDVLGYFLVARADRIAREPDKVRAFADATVRAVRFALDRPEEAAAIMVRRNPTLDRGATLAHWRRAMTAIETPYVRTHGYGVATEDRLQGTIDLVRQGFDLPAALRPGDIYAQGLVGEAR